MVKNAWPVTMVTGGKGLLDRKEIAIWRGMRDRGEIGPRPNVSLVEREAGIRSKYNNEFDTVIQKLEKKNAKSERRGRELSARG